jgi:WD40 repeat protein
MINNSVIKCFIVFLCISIAYAENNYTVIPFSDDATALVLSNDEAYMVVANKNSIKIWNNTDLKIVQNIELQSSGKDSSEIVTDLAISNDNQYLYSVNSIHDIKKWSMVTGKLISKTNVAGAAKILIYNDKILIKSGLEIYTHDFQLKKKEVLIELFMPEHFKISRLKIFNDLLYFSTGTHVMVYSLKTNKLVRSIDYDNITSIGICNNSLLLLGNVDGIVKKIKFAKVDVEVIKMLKVHAHYVQDIAMSHNKKYFASSGEIGPVKIWDAESFKIIMTLPEHKKIVGKIIFSKSDKYLYLLGDDVRRYELDL